MLAPCSRALYASSMDIMFEAWKVRTSQASCHQRRTITCPLKENIDLLRQFTLNIVTHCLQPLQSRFQSNLIVTINGWLQPSRRPYGLCRRVNKAGWTNVCSQVPLAAAVPKNRSHPPLLFPVRRVQAGGNVGYFCQGSQKVSRYRAILEQYAIALQRLDRVEGDVGVDANDTHRVGELLLAFCNDVLPSVTDFLEGCTQPSGRGLLHGGGNICECEDSVMGVDKNVEPCIRANICAGLFTVQILSVIPGMVAARSAELTLCET